MVQASFIEEVMIALMTRRMYRRGRRVDDALKIGAWPGLQIDKNQDGSSRIASYKMKRLGIAAPPDHSQD